MLERLRKFVAALLLLTMTTMVTSHVAYANIDLNDAFNDLTSSVSFAMNKPGAITGQINGFTGGGIELRFGVPTGAISLLTITPPKIKKAGCGGISAYFGGFTFISSAQIKQLIKNISQGAIAFVVNLVIKTLCPMCGSILDTMQAIAQAAAKLAMDGCRIGAALMNKIPTLGEANSGLDKTADSARQHCDSANLNLNNAVDKIMSSDPASPTAGCIPTKALSAVAGFFNDKANSINGWLGFNSPEERKEHQQANLNFYNSTWQVLGTMGYNFTGLPSQEAKRVAAMRVLITNMIGTNVKFPKRNCTDPSITDCDASDTKEIPLNPRLTSAEFYGVLMCGTGTSFPSTYPTWGPSSESVRAYCNDIMQKMKLSNRDIMSCPGITELGTAGAPDTSPTGVNINNYLTFGNAANNVNVQSDLCLGMATSTKGPSNAFPFKLTELFAGVDGMAVMVDKALMCAVYEVRKGPSANINNCTDALALMEAAPFPLYQAVNYAAVYPSSGRAFLSSISLMTSQLMALNLLDNLMHIRGQYKGDVAPGPWIDRVQDAIAQIRVVPNTLKESGNTQLQARELLTAQIREINASLQKEIMVSEIAGPSKFHEALRGSPGIKGASTTATLPATPVAVQH